MRVYLCRMRMCTYSGAPSMVLYAPCLVCTVQAVWLRWQRLVES